MSSVVYLLCLATSLACAGLLLRGYFKERLRLLLWSGLCFIGLALDNAFLFLDVVIYPDIDMSAWRDLPAVLGVALLLFGLVWESR